ncbi:glutathione S-transferase T2 [Brachypodium distachyon]|uniref:glutathione S-transferase T2 n=1 Tax=Brachypodium distachyon TaxID=15368 RepID=UPI00052FFFDA|nr:glutathione S-transferase T2 [Brachypodium distachyon]|eukprot:XP_010239400.1 glutathione S-transferase T2 [Brachypodium distachyon]
MGQYPPRPFGAGASSSPSSPVGCMPFLGADGGSSRQDESSPIGVDSPISPPYPTHFDPAINNEEGKNYWKEIAAKFNKYATKEQQKSVMQCKNHWTKTTKKVTKFNGVYNAEKTMWPSGCDDHGFMEKVHAKYKSVTKTKRPFAYEHWWKAVKVEAKWRRSYSAEEMNKTNKLNAAGAYSSPSQSTDQEGVLKRPVGRNKAKAQHKSTSKSTDSITKRIADAALVHAEASKVQAEATKVQVEADKERAGTEKEKMKVDKLSTYLHLLHKDTSSYDDLQKSRHEQVVDFLAKELFG